jgi:2-C-methyl-D-erythritol 4-phosphate cytidylyltransferase
MSKYAIIAAGGSGTRMGHVLPKQFHLLLGKPVLWYAVETFLHAFADLQVLLVLPFQYFDLVGGLVRDSATPGRIRIVPGGQTRFESVRNGLEQIPDPAIVFVHDAVRCLVSEELILRCHRTAMEKGNAIPALKSVDSIRVESEGMYRSIDRNRVRIIQTPQTFRSELLRKAFLQPFQASITDEAGLVEQLGEPIYLVEGEETNFKITHPADLLRAKSLLEGSPG